MIVLLLVAAIIFQLAWSTICLLRNLSIARRIGLPYVIIPQTEGVFWFVVMLSPVGLALARWLPVRFGDLLCFNTAGLRWRAAGRMHEKYGPVITLVTPGAVHVVVADPEVCLEIARNYKGYIKPVEQYELLKLFGNNVVAVGLGFTAKEYGELTKLDGGERVGTASQVYWEESISQAIEMLSSWKQNSDTPTNPKSFIIHDIRHSMRSLTLHVISAAGFGVHLSFSPPKSAGVASENNELFSDFSAPKGHNRTFRQALETISDNLVTTLAISQMFSDRILQYAPRFLRDNYETREELRGYFHTLIDNERKNKSEKQAEEAVGQRSRNLLSMLVRSNEQDEQMKPPMSKSESGSGKSRDKDRPLTDDEIVGNVFLFSIAGHDTTAATLMYSLTMLTLHPEVQDRFHKKLDEELEGQSEDPLEWAYELYAKLTGPMCLMNETLRLFPSAPVIPKQVSRTSSQILTINNRPYHIPAGTNITLNPPGAHLSGIYWGPDVTAFDPSRWDPTNTSSFLQKFSTPNDLAESNAPVVLQPKKGAFIPFSAGLRACLGKKFAQVEYCAVVAVLLRRYRLELEICDGETREEAVRRVERIVRNSTNEMGLMMQERFGMVMTERKGR